MSSPEYEPGRLPNREEIIYDYQLHYKQLQKHNIDPDSRITPVLCISNSPYAISIIEREYAGSNSFAVMIYERCDRQISCLSPDRPLNINLINGDSVQCLLRDMVFTNTAPIDRLVDISDEIIRNLANDYI